MNKNLKLKMALLSCCFITAATNAIAGNIPEMAKTFTNTPLYIIELVTTIPSLFQMLAILVGRFVSNKLGYKNTILLGVLLCGVGGVVPVFIQEMYLLLLSRAVFGIGIGFISSTLLTLIVYFFDGKTRSTMIGMQGSIGGLGSFIATLVASQLLVFGWHISFTTYFISFIVLVIVFIFVPDVKNEETIEIDEQVESHSTTKEKWGVYGLSFLMFISVALATLFIIKCSTLITTVGYGSSQDGSMIIMLVSIGSLVSGALYGKMYAKMKEYSLALFYLLCAISFIIGGVFESTIMMLIAGFVLGFGYMAFVPFIQDRIHLQYPHFGESATSTVLIFQSLGAFLAPYLGTICGYITPVITEQFIISGVAFLLLLLISIVVIKKPKQP